LINFIVSSNESHQYFVIEDSNKETILEQMVKYAVHDEVSNG